MITSSLATVAGPYIIRYALDAGIGANRSLPLGGRRPSTCWPP